MKRALIGGIGNVLLGDDGVGPYLVRLLEAGYRFGDDVEIADLGTPALDLTHRIVGLHSLILVDSVAGEDAEPGTVLLYRKQDLLHQAPAQRLDPHSPALAECLLSAELLGAMPENVLLVGIVGGNYAPGCALTPAVQRSLESAMAAVIKELVDLGFETEKKFVSDPPDIWWSEEPDICRAASNI